MSFNQSNRFQHWFTPQVESNVLSATLLLLLLRNPPTLVNCPRDHRRHAYRRTGFRILSQKSCLPLYARAMSDGILPGRSLNFLPTIGRPGSAPARHRLRAFAWQLTIGSLHALLRYWRYPWMP